jgi:hypothetical protein
VTQIVVLVALLAGAGAATPFMYRTGTTLKLLQVNAWAGGFYWQTTKGYSWPDTEYQTLPESLRTTAVGAEVLAAVGLPFKLELGAVLPVSSRSKGTASATGIGDAMVTLRYGVLQLPVMPLKVAVGVGANLPTAPADANPSLGDRTTDFGLGLWANTMKLGIIVGHVRAGYWLNGKKDDTTKVGNMLEYLASVDLALPGKLTPQVAVGGYVQNETEVNGSPVARTALRYNAVSLLLLYRPLPMLVIRPKAGFPVASLGQGGAIPDYTLGLDVWVTLP